MTDLKVREDEYEARITLDSSDGVAPCDLILRATDIADSLKDIIEKQKLYSLIGGKKYVNVEGWQACGAFMSAFPREVYVQCFPDGSYEAKVEIVKDGKVICAASSLCGMDEHPWSKRPSYARRSMAVTRATSKAYRLGFSWIMTMAGYQATPFEEVNENTILTEIDPDSSIYNPDVPTHKTKLANLLVQSGRVKPEEKERMVKASEVYKGKTFKEIKTALGIN